MSTAPDYPSLVAQAEKAVAAVKDPELKRIAFQKILDDLLGSQPTAPRRAPGAPAQKAKRGGSAAARASSRGGPRAYITELIDDGFFKKPKTIANVKAELENRGHHIPMTSLSGPLQRLCQRKILRRQKPAESGTFAYSLW